MVTNSSYVPWCAVTLRSMAESATTRQLIAHVWHDGTVSRTQEAKLRSIGGERLAVEVRALERSEIDQLPDIGRFGQSVWIRCLLPRLHPDIDRMLYLDADTLVTGPLDDVFNTALDGAPIGAVVDTMPPNHWDRVRRLGFVDPADYFNSGVLVMDLDAMRHLDLLAWTRLVATSFAAQIHYPDQDVLNLVFAGQWHRLDPAFNAQNRLYMRPELGDALIGERERALVTERPTVVHFEGPGVWKPWHRLSTHPLRDRYRAVLTRTPFSDVALQGGWLGRTIGLLPQRWWWRAQGIADRARVEPLGELHRLVARTPPPGAVRAEPTPFDLRPSCEPAHPLHGIDERVRAIVDRAAPYCARHAAEVVEVVREVDDRIRTPGTPTTWRIDAGRRGGRALTTALRLIDLDSTPDLVVVAGPPSPGAFAPDDIRRLLATSGYPVGSLDVTANDG